MNAEDGQANSIIVLAEMIARRARPASPISAASKASGVREASPTESAAENRLQRAHPNSAIAVLNVPTVALAQNVERARAEAARAPRRTTGSLPENETQETN